MTAKRFVRRRRFGHDSFLIYLFSLDWPKAKRTWVMKLNLEESRREIKEKTTEKALQFFYERLIEEASFTKNRLRRVKK